jgi:hypothetical protein
MTMANKSEIKQIKMSFTKVQNYNYLYECAYGDILVAYTERYGGISHSDSCCVGEAMRCDFTLFCYKTCHLNFYN